MSLILKKTSSNNLSSISNEYSILYYSKDQLFLKKYYDIEGKKIILNNLNITGDIVLMREFIAVSNYIRIDNIPYNIITTNYNINENLIIGENNILLSNSSSTLGIYNTTEISDYNINIGNGNITTSSFYSLNIGKYNTINQNTVYNNINEINSNILLGGINNVITTDNVFSTIINGIYNKIDQFSINSTIINSLNSDNILFFIKKSMNSSILNSSNYKLSNSSNSLILNSLNSYISRNEPYFFKYTTILNSENSYITNSVGDVGENNTFNNIISGYNNTITINRGNYNLIYNGYNNTIINDSLPAISGDTTYNLNSIINGYDNKIKASTNFTLFNSYSNTINWSYLSSIIGSSGNTINYNYYTIIIGGKNNITNLLKLSNYNNIINSTNINLSNYMNYSNIYNSDNCKIISNLSNINLLYANIIGSNNSNISNSNNSSLFLSSDSKLNNSNNSLFFNSIDSETFHNTGTISNRYMYNNILIIGGQFNYCSNNHGVPIAKIYNNVGILNSYNTNISASNNINVISGRDNFIGFSSNINILGKFNHINGNYNSYSLSGLCQDNLIIGDGNYIQQSNARIINFKNNSIIGNNNSIETSINNIDNNIILGGSNNTFYSNNITIGGGNYNGKHYFAINNDYGISGITGDVLIYGNLNTIGYCTNSTNGSKVIKSSIIGGSNNIGMNYTNINIQQPTITNVNIIGNSNNNILSYVNLYGDEIKLTGTSIENLNLKNLSYIKRLSQNINDKLIPSLSGGNHFMNGNLHILNGAIIISGVYYHEYVYDYVTEIVEETEDSPFDLIINRNLDFFKHKFYIYVKKFDIITYNNHIYNDTETRYYVCFVFNENGTLKKFQLELQDI